MAKVNQDTARAEQQRKTRATKGKQNLTEHDGTRTTWETIRWVGGLMIVLFSLYVFVASVSHLFVWREDLGALANNLQGVDHLYSNVCGKLGAKMAHLLIGKAFGLFRLFNFFFNRFG